MPRLAVTSLIFAALWALPALAQDAPKTAPDRSGPVPAADAGVSDGGLSDGGSADGGLSDGGSADGDLSDGGSADGGLSDGGSADGDLSDGGSPDSGFAPEDEGDVTTEANAEATGESPRLDSVESNASKSAEPAQSERAPPKPEAEPEAAAVAPDVEEATEEESLLPPGEADMMAPHDVDSAAIRFVPGKGLQVTSADGRFRLQTRVRAQFRWTLSDAGDDLAHRFRIRRARVVFSGNTFHKDVRYKFELAFSPNDVGIRDDYADDANDRLPTLSALLDYYIDFRQLRDLQVRVGQSKIFSNRQRVISSGNLQLVDRSLLNGEFTLDRDIGVDLRSRDFLGLDMLRYYAGVFMARGRDSQGFDDFGMLYLGRVEFLPMGMFNDYSEVDFQRGAPRLSIGAGYGYIDRARGDRGIRGGAPADGGTTNTQHVFLDALFKFRGFSAFTEFAWRAGSRNPGDAVDEMGNPVAVADTRDGIGLNLQAGYLLPNLPVEFAARYGLIRGVGDDTALNDANELVVGASYYVARHPYKLQADYTRLWGDSFSEGAHRFRIQLQVSL